MDAETLLYNLREEVSCPVCSTEVTCGNCDQKTSDASYCFQCCMFHCKECVVAHNKIRGSTNHRVLALREFQDKDYEDLLKRPKFCPKQRHQKEELKYFCKNCRTVVCQTCSSLEHSGHTLEHIEDKAKRQRTELKTLKITRRQNLQEKQNIVEEDKECVKVIERAKDIKTSVQRFAEKLIGAVEVRKEHINAAVENRVERNHLKV